MQDDRIYLYRDGIRVYPYGDPDDDWLQIDTFRGTISAGDFLSNDQVIGIVKISYKENPRLKDKTNREGLIDDGYATTDFIKLLQVFLRYIRHKPYKQYQIDNKRRETQKQIAEEKISLNFEILRDFVKDNKVATEKLNEIEKDYKSEKQFLVRRAETTENLAGVGLSVETASHDIMRMMNLVLNNLDNLISNIMDYDEIDSEATLKELNSIRGSLGFVHAQLKDIQLLFTSSKQRRRSIQIKDILDKVIKIYKNTAKKAKVNIEINEIQGSPLVAKTTDAVLLQVLLNLFDNSIYWLSTIDIQDKKILITLDGEKINHISKKITPEEHYAVSIDVYRISSEDSKVLFKEVEDTIFGRKDENSWTEVALDNIFKDTCFKPYVIDGRWFEIDNHDDLHKAEEIFKGDKLCKI